MVHNLVDAVERIFLVDDSIEKNAKSPNILLFATIGVTSENFRSRVV
jgi:hypothetical protein